MAESETKIPDQYPDLAKKGPAPDQLHCKKENESMNKKENRGPERG